MLFLCKSSFESVETKCSTKSFKGIKTKQKTHILPTKRMNIVCNFLLKLSFVCSSLGCFKKETKSRKTLFITYLASFCKIVNTGKWSL